MFFFENDRYVIINDDIQLGVFHDGVGGRYIHLLKDWTRLFIRTTTLKFVIKGIVHDALEARVIRCLVGTGNLMGWWLRTLPAKAHTGKTLFDRSIPSILCI